MKSLCIIVYSDYTTDARVIRHAESASRDGYRVDVITPNSGTSQPRESINSVDVYRLRARHYQGVSKALYFIGYINFFLRCFAWLSWRHLERRYDIIQVCNMPDFLVFSTIVAKLTGAKIVLDIHDPMPETYLTKFPGSSRKGLYNLLLWQERVSAAYVDRIITVSEPVKDDILIPARICGNKISVVTNFPDEEIFSPCHGFHVSYPIKMIYYGTIAPRFDLQGVLSAVANIKRKDRIVFKIIGKDNSEVALRKAIGMLRLDNIVEWDNMTYALKELSSIIANYHVGIVPYVRSPATNYMLPVKLMELLAMGIPSITIANAAIHYYIDATMYFAYDPRSMNSLTKIIDEIIDNPGTILNKRKAILEAPRKLLWKTERTKYLCLLAQLSEVGDS